MPWEGYVYEFLKRGITLEFGMKLTLARESKIMEVGLWINKKSQA